MQWLSIDMLLPRWFPGGSSNIRNGEHQQRIYLLTGIWPYSYKLQDYTSTTVPKVWLANTRFYYTILLPQQHLSKRHKYLKLPTQVQSSRPPPPRHFNATKIHTCMLCCQKHLLEQTFQWSNLQDDDHHWSKDLIHAQSTVPRTRSISLVNAFKHWGLALLETGIHDSSSFWFGLWSLQVEAEVTGTGGKKKRNQLSISQLCNMERWGVPGWVGCLYY